MRKLIILLFLLNLGMGYSQHSETAICTLQPDNTDWMWELKKADDRETKIELVVDKIRKDGDYFELHPPVENADDRRVFGDLPCTTVCSIRFVLVYGKSKGLVLDLKKNPLLEDLINSFTSQNIDKIELNKQHRRDIYKPKAQKRSGVVLYTEDKELKKMVRKLLRETVRT